MSVDVADKPVPFEIVPLEGGARVASNGAISVSVLADVADAQVFRRRAVRGLPIKPAAEVLLPIVNQFAGELLQRGAEFPADEAAARLVAMAGLMPDAPPQAVEWMVVQAGDVKVYIDGGNVVITRADLQP